MGAGPDLEVDTGWIRKSAATLTQAGLRFTAAAAGQGPPVAPSALGTDPAAISVARLIALRCDQAQQAAGQLAAVTAGTAQSLTLAADTFDRLDAGPGWHR